MKRSWFLIPALVAGSAMSMTEAIAQAGSVLYNPVRSLVDQEMKVKGWGSGTVSETDEAAYEGTHSLRVTTRNYFQGGVVMLGKPLDLADEAADKSSLLRVVFRQADLRLGGGGPGGAAGGPPGLGGLSSGGNAPPSAGGRPPGGGGTAGGGRPPGAGGNAGPGGFPGTGGKGGGPGGQGAGPGGPPGGFPGGFGGAGQGRLGAGGAMANTAPTMKYLRVIVTTTDGKKSEAYIPTDTSAATQEQGWRAVSVPLQAISGFDRTNKIIKDISFSADQTTTFYVGDLRVVNDRTPIRAEPNVREINRELGADVVFSAQGLGGSSILRYTWDFDASDGIGIDAEGQAVRRKFRKAGTYVITLTVSDYFGLKEPYSTTIKAVINP